MGVLRDMKELLRIPLVLVLLVAGCGGSVTPGVEDPDAGAQGSWQLVEGRGASGPVPILETHRITLTFEDGRAGGTAACNHYGGEVEIDGSELRIDQLAGTDMACEPPEAMEAERLYLDALTGVTAFERTGERLTLTGPDVELVYERLEPPPTAEMTGTRWELESLVHGSGADGTVSSVRGGYLLLEENGTFTGSTGCRELSGEWTRSGDTIHATSMQADGDCTADLEEQDRHVIEVLGDGFRAEVDGQQLALTNPNGEAGLIYRAE